VLFLPANAQLVPANHHGTVVPEASPSLAREGDFERMARRRYQHPKPFREGNYWWIKLWTDVVVSGKLQRKRKRIKLAPANKNEREVQKIADEEYLRPLNQGLESIGSATNFTTYVNETYIPVGLPLMATSTRARYRGIINNYLLPAFGKLCLRDLGSLQLQRYFSAMANGKLSHESIDKVRDVLSSILGSAVRYHLLVKNPMEGVLLPPNRRGKRITKPYITPEQFDQIVAAIPEPYATMVYVAVYSGLRVSELIGLRWNDVGYDCLMVDERYSRGDWSAPKSEASNAAVAVQQHVIERIHALKLKTVSVRAGRAVRRYKAVKSGGPNDLVFQSVKDGKAMRDNNILTRFIKPAARKLGLGFVNWRCLRTSYGTWLKRHGADMKDIQGQMRHSRISTTMDIYVQDIPESRRRAVEKLPVPTTTVQ
jgi:integrase